MCRVCRSVSEHLRNGLIAILGGGFYRVYGVERFGGAFHLVDLLHKKLGNMD